MRYRLDAKLDMNFWIGCVRQFAFGVWFALRRCCCVLLLLTFWLASTFCFGARRWSRGIGFSLEVVHSRVFLFYHDWYEYQWHWCRCLWPGDTAVSSVQRYMTYKSSALARRNYNTNKGKFPSWGLTQNATGNLNWQVWRKRKRSEYILLTKTPRFDITRGMIVQGRATQSEVCWPTRWVTQLARAKVQIDITITCDSEGMRYKVL